MIGRIAIVLFGLTLICQAAPLSFSDPAFLKNAAAAASTNNADLPGSTYGLRQTPDAFSGVTDSKTVTFADWIRLDASDDVAKGIFTMSANNADRLRIIRNNVNVIRIEGYNSAGTKILDASSSVTVTIASGWTHLYIAIDLANSANRHIYFDGTEDASVTWSTYTNDSLDLDATLPMHYVGALATGGQPFPGGMSELWFDDVYLNDPTKFISGGNPVYLGSTGQLPTGSAPALYLSVAGCGDTWLTDSSGNGNNFTRTGAAPFTCTTPPP